MSDEWRANTICPKCKRKLVSDIEKYSNGCGVCTIERITGKPFIPWDEEPKVEKEEIKEEKTETSNGNQKLDFYKEG